MRSPKIVHRPTLPFDGNEMTRILAACDLYAGNKNRMKALTLLMRCSGLRIGDAVRLSKAQIEGDTLFLYTQKTGVPVRCPLPAVVLTALASFSPMNSSYFFWSGTSSPDGVARTYMTRFRKIFKLAGLPDGHSHRFRDTFATELLLKGVPIERVSMLLGHASIRVTEKHYAPWVRDRQQQLEADVRSSWTNELLVGRGTPEVHALPDYVN
jgi:integrase/recombinase XerD